MNSLLGLATELQRLNEQLEREAGERIDLLVVPIPAGLNREQIDAAITLACTARGTLPDRVDLVVLVEHLHLPPPVGGGLRPGRPLLS